MKNIAIVTAREGSGRLPGKHTMRVGGRRILEWPILAALNAKRIERTYLATDSVAYIGIAEALGAQWLRLPPGLCGDKGTQAASLLFAVSKLESDSVRFENVVALLGNTVMIGAEDVDQTLATLDARPEIDSVMTVWRAEDDHPLRAMRLDELGFLRPYGGETLGTSNVQEYAPAFFHDQGVWAFRKRCVYEQQGPPPWTWMGRKCVPIERFWWAGRDVDVAEDLEIAEWWLQRTQEG